MNDTTSNFTEGVTPANPFEGQQPADVIEEYIKLRDQKKVAEDTYKTWVKANFDERMDHAERYLLDQLNKLGLDNFSAPSGTAYKSISRSVSIADMREFRRHVIGSEDYDLADWRANKTVIGDLVDRGEPLPPGVNYSTFVQIGIRRKS